MLAGTKSLSLMPKPGFSWFRASVIQSKTGIEKETFTNRNKFIAVAILMKVPWSFKVAVQTRIESRVMFWGFT